MKNDFLTSESSETLFSYFHENLQTKMAYESLVEEAVETHEPLKIGSQFLDKYMIIKVLGSGNFGMIYMVRANDASKKLLAVKEFFPKGFVTRKENGDLQLRDSLSEEEERSYHFIRNIFIGEAQNLVKVTKTMHPNIVTFFSLVEDVNNTVYFLMNYEHGISLKIYLDERKAEGEPKLTNDEIYNIAVPLLDGLTQIHDVGVYHQDIKLENILIREDHSPLLLDFGASKILYDNVKKRYFNATTLRYAAIEQIELGQPPNIDETTDIYGMGVLLYRLITDTFPMQSNKRRDAIEEEGKDPYVPLIHQKLKGYDMRLLAAVDKALSVEQEERFQNSRRFIHALYLQKSNKKYFYMAVVFFTSLIYYFTEIRLYDIKLNLSETPTHIMLDNKEVNLTSDNIIKVTPYPHTIHVEKEGYYTLSDYSFNPLSGNKITIKIIPKSHVVKIKSDTVMGEIRINDNLIGKENSFDGYQGEKYKIALWYKKKKISEASFTYEELYENKFIVNVTQRVEIK